MAEAVRAAACRLPCGVPSRVAPCFCKLGAVACCAPPLMELGSMWLRAACHCLLHAAACCVPGAAACGVPPRIVCCVLRRAACGMPRATARHLLPPAARRRLPLPPLLKRAACRTPRYTAAPPADACHVMRTAACGVQRASMNIHQESHVVTIFSYMLP